MSVTFLTNEDKTVIDQSVETLDKKIDDLSVDDIDASGVDVNDIHPSWTRNTITSSTGLVSASTTRCTSSVIPVSAGEKIIADPADLKIFPHAYDSEQNYFRLTSAWIEGVYEYVATEDLSIRFVTAFLDDSEITPEDVTVSIQTQLPYDRNLREEIGKLSEDCTGSRITSLDNTQLAGFKTFESVGIPVYVSNVSDYSAYAITETGWYLFIRIAAKTGVVVTAETTITGSAGYIASLGAAYIDVAVRFDVAAQSQAVTIAWTSGNTETFVFKATDLAVRNLDYRTTFYVYDIADYATWSYKAATDATAVGTKYYTLENGVYTQAAVKANESIPDNTYYTHTFALTADTTFQSGKTYYTKRYDVYEAATVTVGNKVTSSTYYEEQTDEYVLTSHLAFAGTAYYEVNDGAYTQAAVKAGEAISGLYVHSSVTFEGMARNITYKCDTAIDCPTTIILPEIEDDIHGCWFEIRFRHVAYYSTVLEVPDGVKVGTEHSQIESAGINMVNLHYTSVAGQKIWRFMNTHTNIP